MDRQESHYEKFCVPVHAKRQKKIPILDTFECNIRGRALSSSLALRQLDAHHSTAHDQLIGDDYGR
jgi:hypothetical protein